MTRSNDAIRVLITLKLRKKNGRPKVMPPADYNPNEDRAQESHLLRAIRRAWGRQRRMEAGFTRASSEFSRSACSVCLSTPAITLDSQHESLMRFVQQSPTRAETEYIITVRRMSSGLALKSWNGQRLVIRAGQIGARLGLTKFLLTTPCGLIRPNGPVQRNCGQAKRLGAQSRP